MYEQILVPLDGSKESETVIPYIADLASKLKAALVLFHVVPRAYSAYRIYVPDAGFARVLYPEREMEALKASAQGYLEKVASRLRDRGLSIRFEVRAGTEAEEIIKLAEEIHADMVAMSPHKRSRINHWVYGSVSNKVVHGGNTPVLLVRAPRSGTT